jgi:diguanylate cyclase (GGDEF)-like protein/PAS domain S-box-containing protein
MPSDGVDAGHSVGPFGAGINGTALLEALPDIVLVIDTLGVVRYANRAVEVQLGHSVSSRVGRSVLELIHPDDVANVLSSLETVRGKQVGTPVEVRVRDRDGAWHWYEEIGTNIVLDDGSPGILCMARDITQRRMWEVAGDDSRKLQQVLQVAPAITLLLDGSGVITGANAAFTRMLGHDQSVIAGKPLTSFIVRSDQPRAEEALAELRGGSARATFEARMTTVGQAQDTCPVRFELAGHLSDPVVNGIVASAYDVTELVAAREELEYLARHDSLTGLATRAYLAQRIDQLLRSDERFALLYIDLDHFKPVNDKWGHDTGDDVLRLVARRLQAAVGPGDVVARVGGDEFVVVKVAVTRESEAHAVAEHLEQVISVPYELAIGRLRLGASVGITLVASGDDVIRLMSKADAAMYHTKSAKRTVNVPG